MFDLETAIKEWRRQMVLAGITSSVALDELESHLRDDIEFAMDTGGCEQDAFASAIKHIGSPWEIGTEFAKARCEERKRTRSVIACGLMSLMAGLTGLYVLVVVTPQPLTLGEQLAGAGACLMLAMTMWAWRCFHAYLPALTENQRGLIFMVGLVLGLISTAALQDYAVEPLRESAPGMFAVAFLWAWAPAVIGATVIFGLNEAARRNLREQESSLTNDFHVEP